MYRIDRHDVMSDVPVDAPPEEQLDYCRKHLIRVNVREGTYNVSPDGRPILSPGDIAAADSGILFGKGWLPMERYTAQEPFRWAGQNAELLLDQPPASVSGLLVDLEPGPGTGNAPLDLEVVGEDYQVLAHVTVDRRSRLRLPLPAPVPKRLWFRVHHGGLPTDRDPRVMNFRAFRFEWDRAASRAGSDSATVRPLGRRNLVVTAWFALQHVIDRLAKGGRLVPLTVPVSPRLRRMLKSYVEWRGFAGMARNVVPYLRRRMKFQAAARPGEDIFPFDSGLAPGSRLEKSGRLSRRIIPPRFRRRRTDRCRSRGSIGRARPAGGTISRHASCGCRPVRFLGPAHRTAPRHRPRLHPIWNPSHSRPNPNPARGTSRYRPIA